MATMIHSTAQMEFERRTAERLWQRRPMPTVHRRYIERRQAERRDLLRHTLGTLIVLGALVLMASV